MLFKRLYKNLTSDNECRFLFQPVLFGIGIGIYFSLFTEPSFLSLLYPTFLFALSAFLCYQKKRPLPFMVSVSCLLITAGMLCAKYETYQTSLKIERILSEQITYIKGTIKQTDTNSKSKTRFLLERVSDFEKPLKGLYRLTTNDKTPHKIGDCVETAAVLKSPSHPLMPTGYQFDRHAFFNHISAIGYTLTPLYQIPCENTTSSKNLFDKINILRNTISADIKQTLTPDEAAIASAVLIGDKSLISQTLYDKYRFSGLQHFLAISGLHMGFLGLFFFMITRFFILLIPSLAIRFSAQKVAAFMALICSFIYLLLSGASLPAQRAFIMAGIVLAGIFFNREAISMRTAAVAALVIFILEPHALLLPGFQMSFAAVCALIAVYEAYQPKTPSKDSYIRKIGVYFFGVMLTSLIATLSTLPYAVYHFGTFAPYAVLSNIIAAPLIAFIIMPLVCLNLIIIPFGHFLYPLKALEFALSLLNKWAEYVSNLPYANLRIPPMSTSALIIITFGGLWLCLWKQKGRCFGFVFIILPLVSYTFKTAPDALYTDTTVALYNKKQDELLIFTNKKSNFLIENWSQGYQNVKVYKNIQDTKLPDLSCRHKQCVWKNNFTFDLNGHLSFNQQNLSSETDLGGAIYLNGDKSHIQTIRKNIGFRPWNS